MASALPIPPAGTPVFDQTGQMTEPWKRYFLSLQNLAPDIPPIDAQYWVSTANTSLTNERNIGALATGYLKITTAAGIATPASTTTIPATDISGAGTLSRTSDTNVTLTLGGTPSGSLLKSVSITAGWSGQLGLSRGGTNADLSATGGTSYVLRQSSAGAAVTVSQLAYTDVSGLAAGVYTPTITSVTNLDAVTAYACQYLSVGPVVNVSGRVDADPTANATATALGISLPIASTFANANECGGVGSSSNTTAFSTPIYADVANARAEMGWTSTSTSNAAIFFTFQYQIL